MDLIKRLGLIVGAFVLCLLIRTLVSPPVVIVGKKGQKLEQSFHPKKVPFNLVFLTENFLLRTLGWANFSG